jgi:hypothetical protein
MYRENATEIERLEAMLWRCLKSHWSLKGGNEEGRGLCLKVKAYRWMSNESESSCQRLSPLLHDQKVKAPTTDKRLDGGPLMLDAFHRHTRMSLRQTDAASRGL